MIFLGDRRGAAACLLTLTSCFSVASSSAPQGNGNFSIVNGQIYTPGLAIEAVRNAFVRAGAPLDFALATAARHHPGAFVEIAG